MRLHGAIALTACLLSVGCQLPSTKTREAQFERERAEEMEKLEQMIFGPWTPPQPQKAKDKKK
jgi:hypothetical protein